MFKLEETIKMRTDSEKEAQDLIYTYKEKAPSEGYSIKKASYEHKEKKSKGEIIDECWPVTVVLTFNDMWIPEG